MRDLLEQLCDLTLGKSEIVEPTKPGLWYKITDDVTQIKQRSSKDIHPCLVLEVSTLKYGYVDLWVRTASVSGDFPEFISHRAHQHGTGKTCGINVDANICVKSIKRIPASKFGFSKPICSEDVKWVGIFDRCYFAVFGTPRSGDFG